MRGKLLVAMVLGVTVCLGQWAWADGGRFDSRGDRGTSIQLVGHGYHSSYSYGRSYSYGWHHPPVVRPPAVVVPFPGHPPVVITPPSPRSDCHRPPYHSYYRYYERSDHGSIGIYGPRFGFSIAW